jgi:hypothetical protein
VDFTILNTKMEKAHSEIVKPTQKIVKPVPKS